MDFDLMIHVFWKSSVKIKAETFFFVNEQDKSCAEAD